MSTFMTNNSDSHHHHKIPSHFQALQFAHRGAKLELVKDVKMHEPKAMEVLVRVIVCSVSSCDRIAQDQLLEGIHYPRTPGMEFIGQICALGEGVKMYKQGEMVGGSLHGGHDMVCERCRDGDFATCDHLEMNGITRDGGLAEYCLMRVEALVKVPANMDPAEMTGMMHQGATIFTSLKAIGLGKLACNIATAMGYRVCTIGEGGEGKQHLGLGEVVEYVDCAKGHVGQQLMHKGGAKVILCCMPESKHLPEFVQGLQSNGQLLLFSMSMGHSSRAELRMNKLVSRRLAIVGHPSPTPLQVEESLRFAKMHDIRVKVAKFSLKEGAKALEMAMDESEMRKAVVCLDQKGLCRRAGVWTELCI